MKQSIFLILTFISILPINAQVVLGDLNYENPNSMLSLINTEDNAESSKGFMLPVIENETLLPLYDPNETDHFQDDQTMEGMLAFQNDIKKVVFYNGKYWEPTLFEKENRKTRLNMDSSLNDNPKVACVLVACGSTDIPFVISDNTDNIDELNILNIQDTPGSDNYSNFTIRESGLYKIIISLGVKTSGIHVTPPLISIRALKNGEVLARNDVPLNEAILITAGANRTGSMEFIGMFDKNDKLKFQISSAVSILTVADVYEVRPSDDKTYVYIEKLF